MNQVKLGFRVSQAQVKIWLEKWKLPNFLVTALRGAKLTDDVLEVIATFAKPTKAVMTLRRSDPAWWAKIQRAARNVQ